MEKVGSTQILVRYGWVDETDENGYRRQGMVPMDDGPWVRYEDAATIWEGRKRSDRLLDNIADVFQSIIERH